MGTTEITHIAQLQDRIHHLEENRRFIQNALEMVLSMADFQIDISETPGLDRLFQEAARRFEKIIPLRGCAVYLVDDQTAEFTLRFCTPPDLCGHFRSQVEFMIEEGFFAWAIRERRGLYVSSQDHGQNALLHVIANNARVQGMFVGLIQSGKDTIPETSLNLLSIVLFNVANVIQSLDLYQMVKHQNQLLEEKVLERTRELTDSQQELKEAVSKLERLAQEADQANRAKGSFLAHMSHEIRTPLNGIIGCTELILKTRSLVECREIAAIALDESEHLLHLINNVLDYSKIEAGKIELEQRPFDLHDLLQSVIRGINLQAQEKGVTLNVQLVGHPDSRVLGDALRLRQILVNLVNNSVKFTAVGSVTVSARRLDTGQAVDRQTICFQVNDTGIGIPKERQAAIFNPFTQADDSTTRRFGGTGLGISIAQQLVALMGGELTLQSEPGKGSTFSFAIDLALDRSARRTDASGRSQTVMAAPADADILGCILVAEDTPVNQKVLRQHLEDAGHIVIMVGNGREAVEACRAQRFDLVLMDIQMPEMDGLQATRQIKAQLRHGWRLPVVALTANADAQTRLECGAAGMEGVLTKPIRREPLLAAVRAWLVWNKGHIYPPGEYRPKAAPPPDCPSDPQRTAPLDLQALRVEFDDPAMIDAVVRQFMRGLPAYIEGTRKALEAGDYESAGRGAHAIKGGAATVEATPLRITAADLENDCHNRSKNQAASAFVRLLKAAEDLDRFVMAEMQPR